MTWRHEVSGVTVVAGEGAIGSLPEQFRARGLSRVFLVSSPSAGSGQAMRLVQATLTGVEVLGSYDKVRPHAPEEGVHAIAAAVREAGADVILAVGGASVLDSAKGAALLNAGKPLELDLALLHGGGAVPPGLLPVIGIPTTLASSEFTPGGAYTRDGHKYFFAAPGLSTSIALYDPVAFSDTPADIICSSGMNALAHCLESAYVPHATPHSRALGAAATSLLTRRLPARAAGTTSPALLASLADAAALSALTFHAGGAGVHHAICHVLGGVLGIPHAVANAAVLPYSIAANEPYSRQVQADLADVMTVELRRHGADPGPRLANCVQALQGLTNQWATLCDLGVPESSIEPIATEIIEREPTLAMNPRPVTPEVVLQILTGAWRGDLALASA